MAHATEQRVYEFGDFRIDADHRMLYHQGSEIPVVPKVVETLLALIERRGKIVSKDELLEAVWPDTVVEESNLFVYLSVLRKTLGTLQDGRPYVETLRRRGYRFNGDVQLLQEKAEDKQNYAWVVDDAERRGANVISQSGQMYLVKDSNRIKGESAKLSPASSALPAIKLVESSMDLMSAGDESVPTELPNPNETSERLVKHAEAARAGLRNDAEPFRRSKGRYVLPVSLGAILLAAVFAGSFYWRSRRVVSTSIAKPNSIAILPFRPLVNDNRDEALELGMADMLITRLGTTLIVRPLGSVQRFQNSNQDPISAGRALEVEAVLEGSIQRIGDDVRVNARLLRVADGAMIWSETFDDKYRNILVLQSTMATRIASALRPHLTIAERTQVEKRYTSNPEAYEYYNRGRVNELKITKEGLLKAIDFFDQAIKADPNYALAYAHKAEAYRLLGVRFASNNEVLPKAFELAQRALAIDPSLAEAHLQVAWYYVGYLRDLTAAEAKFKQVIEMSPNDFQAHLGYAMFLSGYLKKYEEAIDEARRARELSPITPLVFALESQILLRAGHTDDAILQAKKALDFEPNFWVAHLHLGSAYARKNQYDQATAEYQKAIQLAPETYIPRIALARLFMLKGDQKGAYAIARELETHRRERYVALSSVAAIYSELGNKDRALDLVEKAVEEGEFPCFCWGEEPLFIDNLRSEPRFQNILKRLNLDK